MSLSRNALNFLFGHPLATSEERAEHIGPIAGIPIFGLDALSSAAYGPEAALTILHSPGPHGRALHRPGQRGHRLITARHRLFQLPANHRGLSQGGGSYTVASRKLGEGAGLLAAAALMIDYTLTAAVGISAGVGALISAVLPACNRTRSSYALAYWRFSPS